MKTIDTICRHCGSKYKRVSGAGLREMRLAAGLSARELARRLELSAQYICDVENDRRNATLKIRAAYEAL